MVVNIKIGITGLPRSGKTFALKRVIEMLHNEEEEELIIGGMSDEFIIDKTTKQPTRIVIRDLITGEETEFASVGYESKITIGKIGVDINKFSPVAVAAIQRACQEADIIIIDEIGKIEVECPDFVKAVRDALDVDKPMIITLHKKSRNPLLQDIRRRDDVRVLEVTPTNRHILPYKIVRLMKGENI